MVGKKDMCPTCLEKVDLRHLHADRPWERMNVVWGQMLDLFRYLVVWFPVLILTIHLTFYGERREGMRSLRLRIGAMHASPNSQIL